MAFCDKCGAYIPDGQTACLACGYDAAESAKAEQEKAQQAAAAAAASQKEEAKEKDSGKYYSFSNEELREKLEEQRRKQQEASRKWAEEEKQRRQRAAKEKSYTARSGETIRSSAEKAKKAVGGFAKDSKLLAALSYISILFVLPFLFNSDDKFSVYHAKQGAVLFLFGILIRVASFIPLVGAVLRLFKWFCIYKGMSNSLNGIIEPLPYIGQLGEKF